MATTSRSCLTSSDPATGGAASFSVIVSVSRTERKTSRSAAASLPRMHPTTAATSGTPGTEPFRLPRTIEPEQYRLEIEPEVASATFSGTVAIDAVIHEPVDQIVLNAAELAVSDVEVLAADGSTTSCTVAFDDELEQVAFRAPSALPPGPCTVSCRFSGTLNDKLRGFYRSTYDPRRRRADHRDHPVRVGRRPPRLPVLGRARSQGRLRDHPRGRPRRRGLLELAGGR